MDEDLEFIKTIINTYRFDIKMEDLERCVCIDPGQVAISDEKDYISVIWGLESCIALYAWTPGFSYLSHMHLAWPNDKEDFLMENNRAIKCNRTLELCKLIKDTHSKNRNQAFKVGIVTGYAPLDKDHPNRVLIEDGIDCMLAELSSDGIQVERNEDLEAYTFALDARNGTILTENSMITKMNELDKKRG